MIYGVMVFLLGLVFGSFLNCTAMRLVRGEDFVRGRSHCMSCGHELAAWDLVPVASFAFNKGRCRYCKEEVSWRYPVAEIAFAAMSLGLYLYFGPTIEFVRDWVLAGVLFIVALTDLENFVIYNGCLLVGLIAWIGTVYFVAPVDVRWSWIMHHFLAGLAVGFIMLALSLIMDRVLKKESLGGGDIKLFSLLGLYLGYAGAYELVLFSCVLGLVFALARKAMFPDASREFPFGPMIALAGYILLFIADIITNWYFSLL